MANRGEKEEWRLCADWLVRCKILAADHKVTWPESEVFDLAQTLRDGVLICYLLNVLKPGAIDLKDFSQRPQLSQFLCLKNIRVFLHTCERQFTMREADLFNPDDLFDMKDFGKVISTLSKLSKIAESHSRITGFPPSNMVLRRNTDYYNTLESMITGFSVDPAIYEGLDRRAGDDSNDDIYDVVYKDDDSEIYADVMSMQRKGKVDIPGHVPETGSPTTAAAQEEMYGAIIYKRHRRHSRQGSYPLCWQGGMIEPKSQRDYCIKELVETERNYVDALHMLIHHFIRPLKTVLAHEDHVDIFKHIEALYRVHTGFQSDLQQACKGKSGNIPDCFVKWKTEFLIYGDFCSNLPHAQSRTDEVCKNPIVLQSMEKCQKEANDGKFKLRDLLSVPMQRVLKYPLLLKELIKTTEDSHPERRGLEHALEAMQDLALYVNEVKRDHESLQLIQEIQSSITDLEMRENTSLRDYGKLLKDGELRVKSHDENKVKTRYIFLFDKVMLMCKSRMMDKFLSVGETFSFKNALIVSQHRIEEGSNLQRSRSDKMFGRFQGQPTRGDKYNTWGHNRRHPQTRNGYFFLLVERRDMHAYTLQAKTEEIKRKWIDAIAMALDNTQPQGAKQGNHDFVMHSFDKPTTCDVCGKLLRGVFFQGYKCQISNMKVHKECITKAPHVQANGAPQLPPRPTSEFVRPAIGKCKANYSYHGNMPNGGRPVIKFEVSDIIEILSDSDQFWWEGRINGREGFFPANYVTTTTSVRYTARPGQARKTSYVDHVPPNGPHPRPGSTTSITSPPISPLGVSTGGAEAAVSSMPLDLQAYPWYVGEMSRDFAVQRLERHASGTYLIRSRINEPGEYALSIKFGSSVKHIRVNATQDDMLYLADCKLFRTIPDLVEYYQKNTLMFSFPELQTELVTPYKDAKLAGGQMGARGGPTSHNILGYCIANFDYAANQPNQLSLQRSDRIAIISKAGEDRGWWKGQLRGRIGYFPMAYVVEEGDENAFNC